MRQVLFTIPILGGVKIFGYGLMLFLAFLGSMNLAAWRARREKLDPELIYDLAFWVFLGGLVGARLFYVIQYWGIRIHSVWDVFKIWEGGIVLYGSIMGGTAAFFLYRVLRPFPLRPMLDVDRPVAGAGDRAGAARLLPQRLLLRRSLRPALGGAPSRRDSPPWESTRSARADRARRRRGRCRSTRRSSTRRSTA